MIEGMKNIIPICLLKKYYGIQLVIMDSKDRYGLHNYVAIFPYICKLRSYFNDALFLICLLNLKDMFETQSRLTQLQYPFYQCFWHIDLFS